MRKNLVVFSLIFGICMIFTMAWANFYVIPGGKVAKRTILVSPKATEIQSGTALLDALSKITDASETNPYLIILEPGVYDVAGSTVVTKSWVDIQGSGEKNTRIKGNYFNWDSGVVKMASDVELRFLTVEHTGTGAWSTAIWSEGTGITLNHVTALAIQGAGYVKAVYNFDGSLTMRHVTVKAEGSTDVNAIENGQTDTAATLTATDITASAANGTAWTVGVNNRKGLITLSYGTITASGSGGTVYGIYTGLGTRPTLTHLNISAEGGISNVTSGIYNSTPHLVIQHCRVAGSNISVVTAGGSTARIAFTQLLNPVSAAVTGSNVCAGVYDQDFTFYAGTCPAPPPP